MPKLADDVILKGVRVLSNFLGKGDGTEPPGGAAEYRPARADEVQPGLALILGSGAVPAGHEQVLDFLQFASGRGINPNDLWVVVARGKVVWCILPIVNPGRTALLFAPPRRPVDIDVAPLIDAVCDHLAERSVCLAQSLADPYDETGRAMLASLGFKQMAELLYLQTATPRAPVPPELPESFWWQTYSPQTHPLFAAAILDSYQQSLDCPGLNGLRDIEDVIAGHKASGEFNPRFWFVLMERDMPRGVVLLGRVPRADAAELVYLGLAPAVRGRGLSDLMLRQALWAVREMNLSRLTLAVDSHNAPAIRLYYRHGLQRIGSKVALMRDLRSRGAECEATSAD